MQFTVYILFSISLNKFYIGFTAGDINERIRDLKENSLIAVDNVSTAL
jgi:predicted GIY-YIG superfamily endonuclease